MDVVGDLAGVPRIRLSLVSWAMRRMGHGGEGGDDD